MRILRECRGVTHTVMAASASEYVPEGQRGERRITARTSPSDDHSVGVCTTSVNNVLGAMHGIVPIAIFTMGALRGVNPVYLKAARVHQMSRWQTACRILLPASVPEVFTGVRIGFSLTLIGTLLGEMFASQRGLGYLLMQAIGLHNIRMITALTFILVCVAVTASSLLLSLDRRLHRRVS